MKFIAKYLTVLFLMVIVSTASFAQIESNVEKEWTLEDCLKYGLSSHPKVKIAGSTLDSQKAVLMTADSAYDVSLNGSVAYSTQGRDRPVGNRSESVSESLSLSKKIFDPKSDLRKMSAGESLNAAYSQFDSTMIELASKIKSSYFQAQQKRALLKVKLETLDSYEKHLKKVESFVEVGTHPPYDITKALVDVANARVSLISARSNLKMALANMALAMGVEGIINIASYNDDSLPIFDFDDTEKLVEEAMDRPDVKAKKSNLRASAYNVDRAKKELSPSLSASAGYSWKGDNTPQDRGWNAGLSLSLPLFDGRISKAQIISAKSAFNGAEAGLSDLKLSVYTELENAITDLTDAIERYEANNILVRQASESLELAEGRYDTGVGSPLEVSDARVEYSTARGNYIVSFFDSLIAGAALDRILVRIPREYSANY